MGKGVSSAAEQRSSDVVRATALVASSYLDVLHMGRDRSMVGSRRPFGSRSLAVTRLPNIRDRLNLYVIR